MRNRFAVSLIATSLMASGAAFAQSTTVEGAANGARAGGDVAGPIGAMVGGTVGAAVGAGLEIPNAVITSVEGEVPRRSWFMSALSWASRCRRKSNCVLFRAIPNIAMQSSMIVASSSIRAHVASSRSSTSYD
jgi:hypothetical protein